MKYLSFLIILFLACKTDTKKEGISKKADSLYRKNDNAGINDSAIKEIYVHLPIDSLTDGVVKMNEKAKGVLKLYNGDGTVWKTIKISDDAKVDTAIAPFSIKIDYQNLVFRCIGKGQSLYKVIVNEKSGLVKFIKKDDVHFEYEPWSKHVLSVFSVDFDDATNPIKTTPDNQSKSIDYDKDQFYHPVEVKGDWMKIKWGDVIKEDNGWIKWKSNNKLLIQIYYTS